MTATGGEGSVAVSTASSDRSYHTPCAPDTAVQDQGTASLLGPDMQHDTPECSTPPGSIDQAPPPFPALLQSFSQQLQAPSSACLVLPATAEAAASMEISHGMKADALGHSAGAISEEGYSERALPVDQDCIGFVSKKMMQGFDGSVFVDCRADTEQFHAELVTALAVLQKEGRIPRPSRSYLLSKSSVEGLLIFLHLLFSLLL